MHECSQQWPTNECKVTPAYSQRIVTERETDKPKTTKGKEYDLMMLVYIYRCLGPAVAFNESMTKRLSGDFNHHDGSRSRAQ